MDIHNKEEDKKQEAEVKQRKLKLDKEERDFMDLLKE